MKLQRTTLFALAMVTMAYVLPTKTAEAAIPWRENVKQAVTEAARSGKPLLVSISTDWCHYCKKMDRETLSNTNVAEHIEQCFVPLKVDGDKNKELAKMLGVRSFPTMVIMSSKMKVLSTLKGYRTAEQLTSALDSICLSKDKHQHTAPPRTSPVAPPAVKLSAFEDYCPVTSFHSQKLVKGDRRIAGNFRGFEVRFASSEAMEQFKSTPDKYWPIIDGHCVVSAVDEDLLRKGSWAYGVSYADRIWFFSSQENKDKFAAQPMSYLDGLVKLTNAK